MFWLAVGEEIMTLAFFVLIHAGLDRQHLETQVIIGLYERRLARMPARLRSAVAATLYLVSQLVQQILTTHFKLTLNFLLTYLLTYLTTSTTLPRN